MKNIPTFQGCVFLWMQSKTHAPVVNLEFALCNSILGTWVLDILQTEIISQQAMKQYLFCIVFQEGQVCQRAVKSNILGFWLFLPHVETKFII